MSITSGKVIICMGLAVLAQVACVGRPTWGEYTTSTGATTGGGADGAGGGGGSMEAKEVDMFKCYPEDGITPDATIDGSVHGPDASGPKFDYEYIPNELTVSVGQIVKFVPFTTTQNMASGVPPEEDGKFRTPQGYDRCLKFNVAGTYPFWSIDSWPSDPMLGTIYVE